jgi:hypothetical protein
MVEVRQRPTLCTQRTKSRKGNQLKQLAVVLHHVTAFCFGSCSPLLEIALVLVRFNHVANGIVNANHRHHEWIG